MGGVEADTAPPTKLLAAESKQAAAPPPAALIVCVGGLVLASVGLLARLLRGSKVRTGAATVPWLRP